jgi:formate dehydrogenase major subunit
MESHPENYNMTYVREYTNASYLVNPDFSGPADTLDGLFSGWDGSKYDKATWTYQSDTEQADGIKKDPTLTDPDCVFQLLKRHYGRYTDDKVVEITGADKGTFQEICRTYAATGKADKAGAIVFSSSACQRTTGTQTVRTFGILQLLLGNLGVAGGGLDGITGASNGLGCTLQGLVNHWGPGAGSVRPPSGSEQSFDEYGGKKGRFSSILKAWWGDVDHNSSFNYFPKRDGDYSWQPLFKAINDGIIKGLICWGMNPTVSGPNSTAVKQALSKLDWMLVVDLWETETAAFWKTEAGANPTDINTEVFFLPAAHILEKEGSVCNTCRWNQWRYKGSDSPGDARSDLEIINDMVIKLKELYAGQSDKNAEAITNLTWEYGNPPDVHIVAKEMNGYDLTTDKLLSSPGALKADGTTSCGNWLWCGMYTEDGNMAARRGTNDPSGIGLFANWGWAWPLNRRIMYNRASVDLDGNPWDIEHPVLQWDVDNEKWLGDIADGGAAPVNKGGGRPFIMKPEGRGYIFGPGRPDGPFPEHYEPWESPISNPMSTQQNNPAMKSWETVAKGDTIDYPIVATTHRMVEHLHTGAVTRRIPWLAEAIPDMFVEMSNELAEEKGIANGDTVIIKSARGSIKAAAVVTARIKPSYPSGIHHINLPWNWGFMGPSKGDAANTLTARIGDPNTGIPEFRSFLCNVRRAD